MPEPDFSAQLALQIPPSRVQRSRSSGTAIALLASLLTTGGLTGVIWLGQAAIAPQIVQAYTTRVDVSIDNLPGETYETLIRRAEAVARAAAQRSFDRDILVTSVSVIITAQNGGATAPLLSLEVSRAQWRSFPDTRRWATYYRSARALLGFERVIPPAPAVQVSPPAPPPVTPATPAPAGTDPTNAPGTTPAPAGTTPAPAGTTPAPAGTTPAPAGTTPTNAPAGTTPAPAGTTPAPAGTTPAPAGTTPTNAPGTPTPTTPPAPAGTTTPATPATTPTPATPNTSPAPTPNTSPAPTPPTTPGTPGSTPAPGTTP